MATASLDLIKAKALARARWRARENNYELPILSAVSPTPILEVRKPEQTVAEYNATNLLRIYGGHDAEAALLILRQIARSLGLPMDSLDRFLAAGYVPQPKQLAFHAAARACDLPNGPTRIAMGGARGPGKALALDTPIPSPDGWTTMRKIAVGDKIFAPDGSVTVVTGCSDIQTNRECYELLFSDGARITADGDHLWATNTLTERRNSARRTEKYRARRRAVRPRRGTGLSPWTIKMNQERKYEYLSPPPDGIRTTKDIATTLFHRGETNHAVRVASPLELPHLDLPIDPYVLGTWLGDGDSNRQYLTCFDRGILDELTERGYPPKETKESGKFIIGNLSIRHLRDLGVFKNKHIPAAYLRSAADQRLDLLQGLMDTDGGPDRDGGCEFTSTRYPLARGVFDLALSLGIKPTIAEGIATLNGREIGPKWRVRFSSALPVFRLKRKIAKQKQTGFNGTTKLRFIVDVRAVESVPVKCITVSHPSHCFLAGEHLIPTHNSHSVLAQVVIDDCQRYPGLKFLYLRKVLKAAQESFEDLRRNVLMGIEHKPPGNRGVLTLPNESRVVLGHYGNEKDIDAYLGLEYDGVAIEETTQLSESKVRDIATCIRTSKSGWRPREYNTANPGGIGHAHFKRDFVEPARKGTETTTRFIFATSKDNIFLNPEYRLNLDQLTGWKLKAWKEGDWDIAAGQYFSNWRRDAVVRPNLQISSGAPVWAALDYGFTHPTVAYLFSEHDGKKQIIDEHWRQKALVSEHTADIVEMLGRHDLQISDLKVFYAGHDVFDSRGNASGKTIANEYEDNGIKLVKANIDRINGAGLILKLLGSPDRGIEPELEISDRCVRLIECLPAMQHDPHRPEDVLKVDINEDGSGGDDPYDCARYGLNTKTKKGRVWVGV